MSTQFHQDFPSQTFVLALWEHVPLGILVFDADGQNLGGNAEATRILGRLVPLEFNLFQVLGELPKGIAERVHKVRAGHVMEFPPTWYRLPLTGSVPENGNGQLRPLGLAGRGIPIKNARGHTENLIYAFQDVTALLEARDTAQERQRQAEAEHARLAAVIEQLPAGIVVAERPDGRITLANQELERILGHGLLKSSEVSEYSQWNTMHPDGRPYAPEDHPLARAVVHDEVVENEEVHYRRPDGFVRVLSVNAAPVRDSAGRPHSAVVSFIDISGRKRAELAQRVLAEAGQTLVSTLDVQKTLQNTVDLAVPTLADLAIIYLREGDLVRRLALAHADPQVVARYRGVVDNLPLTLKTHNPALEVIRTAETVVMEKVSPQELQALALDEAHLDLLIAMKVQSILMVPLAGRGHTVGALGFMLSRQGPGIDAVLRATAEGLGRLAGLAVENAKLFADAQESTRLREEFLAIVSHDLRNPLSVVDMVGHMLRRQVSKGPDVAHLDRAAGLIQRAVERMRRLIDDLLDLESIRSAHFSVERRPERIADIIQESCSTLQMVADQGAILLTMDVSRIPPDLHIPCDRGRLLQVLGNLIDNAIKYSPAEAEVIVSCWQEGDSVEVSVADRGPGVRPEDQDKVFAKFWQRDRRWPGAGLGLSIAKGIVAAHGGRIWIESRQDNKQGSVFRFCLPAS